MSVKRMLLQLIGINTTEVHDIKNSVNSEVTQLRLKARRTLISSQKTKSDSEDIVYNLAKITGVIR